MLTISPRLTQLGVTSLLLMGLAAAPQAQETIAAPASPAVRLRENLNTLQFAALPASPLGTARRRQLDPLGVARNVVPIAIRLGAMVSPRSKFIGGADFSFPSLRVGPLYGRLDADAIISANFGGITTLVPVTFNGVYAKSIAAGGRIYGGGGIGPYFGEVTRFGGKLFIGGDFNNRIGLEADLHFAGQGEALVTVQARFGL